MERALADPSLTDAQRVELKMKYAEMRERLAIRRLVADDTPSANSPSRVVQVRSERVSADLVNQVLSTAAIRVGDPINEEVAKRLRAAASTVDEHLRVELGGDGKGGVVVTFILP